MRHSIRRLATSAPLVLAATCANAAVVISLDTTRNMSCSDGVCMPTAKNAVLNASDLENLLAAGNVRVRTVGAAVQADNIDVGAPVSWSTANTLALDAYESIAVERKISVEDLSGLSLTTNDGGINGTLSFGARGRIKFRFPGSQLTINGAVYTLVDSIATLAAAMAADPAGNYALADDYDANRDGTYSKSPITTTFTGTMEGLGNTISHITVRTSGAKKVGGLFAEIGSGGTVANLGLAQLSLAAGKGRMNVGGLVASNEGALLGDHVLGAVSAIHANTGGLAGGNAGSISDSYTAASVSAKGGQVGGLVGWNSGYTGGTITESFATGSVAGKTSGGLVGFDQGRTSNSYAIGAVRTGNGVAGGLLGVNGGSVSDSYSTGAIKGAEFVGGFEGGYELGATQMDCYWDTTTSGTDQATGDGSASGITGLTTKQLRSGLPAGFDPTIWAEKNGVNKGFPYLIANPPPR